MMVDLLKMLLVLHIALVGLSIFSTLAILWIATVACDFHKLISPILKAEDSDKDEGHVDANPE